MLQKIRSYSARSVPRYTSYPTVPHFSEAIGAEEYGKWLSAIEPEAPVSLYLHVPFCRQLCWYCGCNMKLAARAKPIEDYAETLRQEIELVAANLSGRRTLTHLHWGGGTPTALSPADLRDTMDIVRAHFDVAPGAELAIESDPRTLTDPMIEMIGSQRFTRASFGVQEFDPKVQAAINRIQPPEMVRKSVDGLQRQGVKNFNFDLIYGLPHQTVETLKTTIHHCVDMRPDRIALFGYAHVPWVAKNQRLIDEAALPGTEERLHQASTAAQLITDAGYRAIGLDHFARPNDPLAQAAENGTLRRNFQGYTSDRAEILLAVGVTAIGRTRSGFVQNISETGAWARAVKAGVLPVAKGHAFTGDDQLRAEVIESIMCQGAVDLDVIAKKHAIAENWYADANEELWCMANDGLITRDAGRIALTKQGVPLARLVAAVFDSYLKTQSVRHSVAV